MSPWKNGYPFVGSRSVWASSLVPSGDSRSPGVPMVWSHDTTSLTFGPADALRMIRTAAVQRLRKHASMYDGSARLPSLVLVCKRIATDASKAARPLLVVADDTEVDFNAGLYRHLARMQTEASAAHASLRAPDHHTRPVPVPRLMSALYVPPVSTRRGTAYTTMNAVNSHTAPSESTATNLYQAPGETKHEE